MDLAAALVREKGRFCTKVHVPTLQKCSQLIKDCSLGDTSHIWLIITAILDINLRKTFFQSAHKGC